MKRIVVTTFLVVVIFAAVVAAESYLFRSHSTPTANTEPTVMKPPSTNPGSSAPPGALKACQNQNVNDVCSFTLYDRTVNGRCQTEGTTLACGPVGSSTSPTQP